MKNNPLTRNGAKALVLLLAWVIGNKLYFKTFAPWSIPAENHVHWIIVATLSAFVINRALTVRGSLEDKLQQVLITTAVLFGAYAITILIGRLYFSRSVLATMIPSTVLLSLGIAWLRHKRAGMKTAVITPLVPRVPPDLLAADMVTDPQCDFGKYDVLLVDLHEPVSGEWARALSRAMLSGCRVRHLEDQVEELLGATSIDHFELEHMAATNRSSYIQIKRILDIVGAVLLLPVAVPIIAVSGLLVVLTSGWPVFYVHDRVGLGGRSFKMWKLRTMRPARAGEKEYAAVPGDSRVTRIGRILRRARIDELPQLWNVIKGDMSLIGPRPEVLGFHEAYTEAHPKFAYRCLVRPGITGWAQVNAPPSATADEALEKLRYDLYYVKRQSFVLDLQIFFGTIWTLLHGGGVR